VTVVAVIGLGAMGRRIAERLVRANHDVLVWNRSPEKTRELTRAGATAAATPAEAVRRSEAVIVMVADPAALQAVSEGPDGIGAGADGSTLVVNSSTVGPTSVRRLAEVLPDGVALLDAPVLGSLAEAESGSLTIFVGGAPANLERALPLLRELGSPIHVGDVGAGSAAKLVANFTLFGVLGIIGEAIAAADALGLDRDAAFAVLAATPVAAQAERRRPAIAADEYQPRFALSLARKDVGLLTDATEGLELRVLAAARAWLEEAEAAGRGGEDYSAVLAQIVNANARASSPDSAAPSGRTRA
jgi:3-hydroxyisobutyrate dehydrogenase-like beta-hydroxyacid dehydrogenase